MLIKVSIWIKKAVAHVYIHFEDFELGSWWILKGIWELIGWCACTENCFRWSQTKMFLSIFAHKL